MKSTVIKGLVSLSGLFLLNLPAFAQSPKVALEKLNAQYPQEKIFIHYDKDYYRAGETIWFKAYLYGSGVPSGLSHNFYLQLVNAEGKLIDSKVYPVDGATVAGDISLPAGLPQGNYYIRAATPLILNQEEAFVYRKNIPVYNSGPVAGARGSKKLANIQFYPEGGNLIDGIVSFIAFKAVDELGYPVAANGVIRATTGMVLASFKTSHDGIGRVQIKPAAGQVLNGEVEIDGKLVSFPLPEVKNSGVNIKVTDEKGGKLFQLTRGEKEKQKYENVSLLVQQNNEIVYRNTIGFEDYMTLKGHLLTDSLQSGILHFTVFDAAGKPIAERLSFVNNKEYTFYPEFSVLKAEKEKRGLQQYELKFPAGMQAVFSVSVTDASVPTLPDGENIYSRLLFSSDLKDHVFDPSYYFTANTDSARLALDNLLLTHRWSKFEWEKLLGDDIPAPKFKDNYFRTISGVVIDEKNQPVAGGKLNLVLEGEDSSTQIINIEVGNDGRFKLDSILIYGKSKIRYGYAKGKKPPKISVQLDPTPMDSLAAVVPSTWKNIQQNVPGRDVALMNARGGKKPKVANIPGEEAKEEEEEVVTKGTDQRHEREKANEKYATGLWKASGTIVYEESMQANPTTNVIDYILQNVSTVMMQGGTLVNRKNFSINSGQHWPIGPHLDESLVSVSNLSTIRMQDVGLIKFYESGFVGVSTLYSGGAISVYRKKEAKQQDGAGLPYVPYTGYSISRDFKKSDNKELLYWNPSIYVDGKENKVSLGFANNDTAKKLKVTVVGFDASGKLLHFEKIVEPNQ